MCVIIHTVGVPSPPENVQVTKVVKTSVTVEWRQPKSDGGAKIRRYHIFRRTKTTTEWTKVTSVDQYKTYFTVDDLEFDMTYIFGVAAENEVGVSETSETKEVKIERPIGIQHFCHFYKSNMFIEILEIQ